MHYFSEGFAHQYSYCAVHGFAQAVYDVDEDDRLDTEFRLNVKGMTAFPGLNISGTITTEAAGTASKNKQLATACVVPSL